MTPPLKATVVIPVYNEEGILESAVVGLVDRLEPFGISYEVLLAENGSRDNTVAICQRLGHRLPQVKHFSVGTPGNGNYGLRCVMASWLLAVSTCSATRSISATPAFIDARWSSWRAERPSS